MLRSTLVAHAGWLVGAKSVKERERASERERERERRRPRSGSWLRAVGWHAVALYVRGRLCMYAMRSRPVPTRVVGQQSSGGLIASCQPAASPRRTYGERTASSRSRRPGAVTVRARRATVARCARVPVRRVPRAVGRPGLRARLCGPLAGYRPIPCHIC